MAEKKPIKKEEESKNNINTPVNVNRSSDFGIVYSDTARMSVSAFDIKITFSVNDILPNGTKLITEIVTIALAPLHAKMIAESLAQNVKVYEEQVMSLKVNEALKIGEIKSLID